MNLLIHCLNMSLIKGSHRNSILDKINTSVGIQNYYDDRQLIDFRLKVNNKKCPIALMFRIFA